MTLELTPRTLRGQVDIPPSKSALHRALLASALSDGECRIEGFALSEDVAATLDACRALGAECRVSDGVATVRGLFARPPRAAGDGRTDAADGLPRMDCGESGATLRLCAPIALALYGGGVCLGAPGLMRRPLAPYLDLFAAHGIECTRGDTSLVLRGRLRAGEFWLDGHVSSQFVSGLLFALALLEGDSRIGLRTPLVSRGYVDMTIDALRAHGVTVARTENGFCVGGGQRFRAADAVIERDWSQAAFFLTANALGSEVALGGLAARTTQPDAAIVRLLEELERPGDVTLDMAGVPDLVPPIAVRAALREGRTTLCGAAHLRGKESDRLAALVRELTALGADIRQTPDGLVQSGVRTLRGGTCHSHGDHRIAMALAIAATRADRAVTLTGAACTRKSWPAFWQVYEAAGGRVRRAD